MGNGEVIMDCLCPSAAFRCCVFDKAYQWNINTAWIVFLDCIWKHFEVSLCLFLCVAFSLTLSLCLSPTDFMPCKTTPAFTICMSLIIHQSDIPLRNLSP